MKIILSSNPYRDHGMKAVQQARDILQNAGVETVLCHPFEIGQGNVPNLPRQMKFSDLQEELPDAQMMICFGGDGTILHAAKDAAKYAVPILGVNMGSVGFMAELENGEMQQLSRIAKGEYTIEERMMLRVRVLRGKQVVFDEPALNDAVLSKGAIARVAEVEVYADDVLACAMQGDGVIIATPTGSTAYSMSAGGPIIEPTSENLVVTPVCAHQLGSRPLVMSADRTILVRLPRKSRKNIYLSVDGGKSVRIAGNDRVEICRADCRTKLVRLAGKNFYQLLNQKLGGYRL